MACTARIYTVNSEIFVGFFLANSVKRHICHAKNAQLGHDLPTSVNGSDFAISRGLYFHDNGEVSRN